MAGSTSKLSLDMAEQIRAEYDEGDSTGTLADRYQVDPETIRRAIQRTGGTLRRRCWRKPKPVIEEIIITDTRPHGAKHIPALDYRLTREERAAAQLKNYFSNEEGRR